MFFGKKDDGKLRKCDQCGSRSEGKFSFCPFCGNNFVDGMTEREDFGLLGRNDFSALDDNPMNGLGMMDKLIGSMVNNLIKNLDKQMRNQIGDDDFENAEVKALPNGIRIQFSNPMQPQKKPRTAKVARREVNASQMKKMGSLPRAKAKASVKRFGDKVIYELTTPGVISADDVFVSKLESGYEVKAIGDKKVYVNSVPINLPLKKYSIMNNKLLFEFVVQQPVNGGF